MDMSLRLTRVQKEPIKKLGEDNPHRKIECVGERIKADLPEIDRRASLLWTWITDTVVVFLETF